MIEGKQHSRELMSTAVWRVRCCGCAHLGHLHHLLTPQFTPGKVPEAGRLDRPFPKVMESTLYNAALRVSVLTTVFLKIRLPTAQILHACGSTRAIQTGLA